MSKQKRKLKKNQVQVDQQIYDIGSPSYAQMYEDKFEGGDVIWDSLLQEWMSVPKGMNDAWEESFKEQRIGKAQDKVRKGRAAVANPLLELTGAPGVGRFAKDPMKNLEGAYNVVSDFSTPQLAINAYNYMQGNPFFNFSNEDLEGLANTADVVGAVAPLASPLIKQSLKIGPKAIKNFTKALTKNRLPQQFQDASTSGITLNKPFQVKPKVESPISTVVNEGVPTRAITEMEIDRYYQPFLKSDYDKDLLVSKIYEYLEKNPNVTDKELQYLVLRDSDILKMTNKSTKTNLESKFVDVVNDLKKRGLYYPKDLEGIKKLGKAFKGVEPNLQNIDDVKLKDIYNATGEVPSQSLSTEFTPEELLAIDRYSKGFDSEMNSLFRRESNELVSNAITNALKEDSEILTNAIKKNKFNENAQVARMVRPFKAKIKQADGNVVEKMYPTELVEGDEFLEKGFMSTSTYTNPYEHNIIIDVPGNEKQSFLYMNSIPESSHFINESEALLPPGLNLKHTGKYKNIEGASPKKMPIFQITNPYMQAGVIGTGAAGTILSQMSGKQISPEQKAMGGMIKRKDGSYSQRGLWDNIRANKGSGKKPTKEMLAQEKKIKKKMAVGGVITNDMNNKLPKLGFGATLAPMLFDVGANALMNLSSYAVTNMIKAIREPEQEIRPTKPNTGFTMGYGGMIDPSMYMQQMMYGSYAQGGQVPQNIPVEVEGQEMYEMPNGQMGEFEGPSHENGGIPVALPEGTKVYSDRLKINGKTMADRKDKRERNIAKLEKLLGKTPHDKFLRQSLERQKETAALEEQSDMAMQEQANQQQAQQEQAMMQEQMMAGMMQDPAMMQQMGMMMYGGKLNKYAYGGEPCEPGFVKDASGNCVPAPREISGVDINKAFRKGGTGQIEPPGVNPYDVMSDVMENTFGNIALSKDPYFNTKGGMMPNLLYNEVIGNKMLPEEDPKNPNKFMNFLNNAVDQTGDFFTGIFDGKGKPKKEKGTKSDKTKSSEGLDFTRGDYMGLAGNIYGGLGPMMGTFLNRMETPKNQNFFREYGAEGLRAMQEAQALAAINRDKQLADIKLQEEAGRQRGRNSARGVNTLRALDIAADMGANQAQGQAYNAYAQQMMQMLGQKAQMENQQDQMVMQGETARDLADRQDVDNFYTNLVQNLSSQSELMQKTGRDLNTAQYNKMLLNMSPMFSKYGIGLQMRNGEVVFVKDGKTLTEREKELLIEKVNKEEAAKNKVQTPITTSTNPVTTTNPNTFNPLGINPYFNPTFTDINLPGVTDQSFVKATTKRRK